jgi:P4 family phage/plasmid primase-like protien
VRSVAGAWDPEVIDQAIPQLPELLRTNRSGSTGGEPPVELDPEALKVWRGERPKLKDGQIDRSGTLVKIGRVLYDALANRAVIVAALRERDVALGYRKYTGRVDAEPRYHEIVDELESRGRNGQLKKTRTGGQVTPLGGQGPGVTKLLADAILEDDRFAQDVGGKLYRFSGGAYRQHAERYIRRRVKEILEDQGASDKWSSHRANEVVEYLRADAPELWERPPLDEVNVLNGILNVETKRLREHDPAFMSPVQIPVEYDPAARCPAWEQFVSETFPEDAQELAFELPADLITPRRSVQKSILLIGEGSNGKSTYLRALTGFVGSPNTAGVSLHKLESDRFATARLIGKLANICPDLPSTHLTETSAFKAITGGDDLGAEYKYREAFEFRPYCRLVFSANHVPRSGDASHAFFRRWLVVPFERTFEPDEQIPREQLDAKLSDPQELSGVLNRALEALPRLRREGFTESASMREAWEEFRAMTDPVSVWLAQNTVEAAEAFVPKDTLAKAYNEFCDKVGRPGMNKKGFGRAVKRAFPHIEEGQKSVSGKMTWCWLGIGLKSGGPDTSTHTTHGTNEKLSTCFENEIPPEKKEIGDSQETNSENSVSSVSSVSAEQARRIRKLTQQGMSEALAREEVLGRGWVEP